MARAGVQPATFALGVRRSMQLSYRARGKGDQQRLRHERIASCLSVLDPWPAKVPRTRRYFRGKEQSTATC